MDPYIVTILQKPEPPPSITFLDGDKKVGRLTWDDGVFHFEGNADESAKLFLGTFSAVVSAFIETQIKNRTTGEG